MTAPPPPIRTYTTSRDSSSTKQTSDYLNPPQLDPFPLSSPFEERFPQPTSTFSLPHSRTASSSSSVSTDSARSNGHASGGGFTKLPRTTSSSTWGDFSHDVELLLGEEGRGKSPSRNGGPPPRSTTPSRSNSQLSQQSQSRWNLQDYNLVDGPSTPRSSTRVDDDQDTTPKGQLSERSPISNQSQFASSTRPLHTPPQLLPSSIFDRTSSSSPHSRSRMTSHASSSSALRPPSAQSHSSNSSTYSLEDNSWATDLAPPLHSDDEEGHELTSPRSPFLMMETRRNGGSNEVQATRPLSEFDFAAAYARSDGGGSIPGSPMLPTVGIVEPASPVAASNPNSTDRRFEDSNFSSSKPPSTETFPLPRPLSDPSTLHPEPQPPLETTPSSSRAPSPTPSLSPNIRPTSRASSTTTRSNLSSPVRPPRRQPSNLSLVPPKPEQQQPSTSSSSSSSSPPCKETSSSSVLPENSPNPIITSSSLPPTSSSSSNPTSPSPRGSPRPPSIPEKSRRRASTLGLGLKKGHGRKESRDLVVEGEGEKGGSRPGSVFESRDGDVTGGGGIGNGNGLGSTTSFSNPNTPLSASDFAEVYGKLDPEWDDTSSINSSSIVTGPRSTTTSPIISRSSKQQRQQPSSSSTSHVRDPAASSDSLDLPETTRTVGSLVMEERSNSIVSMASENERKSTMTTGGRETDEDVFSDARTGVPPNPVSSPRFESSKITSLNGGVESVQEGGRGENRLLEVTSPVLANSRSTTPKGDAKARAAAFIADLKKSREEAGKTGGGGAGGVPVRPAEEDETIKVQNRVQNRPEEEEDTVTIASTSRIAQAVPAEGSTGRTSESSTRPPSRSQPSSRSSTLPHPSSRVPQQQPPPRQSTLPPLLRRRPLPMAIQASGELTRARTAGERARIYASKINELSREKSRLDEWIDAVRNPRSAMGRAAVASPTASPLKTARSFRQDASTATFAPRGDGYRAKEITHSTFGPRDLQSATSPYPGVLGYNLTPATSASSSIGPSSQQRSLGSGLPAVSIQPGGGSNGGGKPSFFSRSLGRRTSKREPPSSSALLHGAGGGGGGGVAGLPISNPSPLLYSSSSTTTTAPQNLRSIGGPRMPGAGGGPTLNSRASFDSRSSTPTNSPLFQQPQQTSNPYQKRGSFSFASNAISPPSSSILHSSTPLIDSTPLATPTSPNSFTSVSTSPSPLLPSTTNPNSFEEGIDQGALSRLIDVLPQAPREELVKSLRKAGGGDDILAISIYLSEREAGISGK